jgi:hypothetical protein
LRRNPYRKKEKAEKVFFYLRTTFKKNKSGRDFQQGQIWNDRSQKQKKNDGSHPMEIRTVVTVPAHTEEETINSFFRGERGALKPVAPHFCPRFFSNQEKGASEVSPEKKTG